MCRGDKTGQLASRFFDVLPKSPPQGFPTISPRETTARLGPPLDTGKFRQGPLKAPFFIERGKKKRYTAVNHTMDSRIVY